MTTPASRGGRQKRVSALVPRGSFLSAPAPVEQAQATKPLTDTDKVREFLRMVVNGDKFWTASEIAEETELTSAHVNALLSKMIKNGHVERRHPARRGQFCNGRPGQAYRWKS